MVISTSKNGFWQVQDGAWRRPSLLAVLRFSVGVGTVWLAAIFASTPGLIGSFFGLTGIPLMALLWLALSPRLSDFSRFCMIEAGYFGFSLLAVLIYGAAPGVPVLLGLFVLVAVAFYDWKGGIAAGAASVLLIGAGGWAWTSGVLPLSPRFPPLDPAHRAFWMRSLFAQVLAAGGITVIVTYIFREKRVTLSRLRLAEEKFSKAFRACPDAMVITDLESGRYIEVNDNHERLFGYRREEAIGRTSVELGIFQNSGDREEYAAPLRAGNSVHRAERQVRDRAGAVVDVMYSADCIEIGGRKCVVTIIQDITERKRGEKARRRLEEQLRQSQKLESIGTLASGIAHDFNSVLTAINCFNEMALRHPETPEAVRAHLVEVRGASRRATDLVKQILTFSRQQPVNRVPQRIHPIVNDALKLLRATVPATTEIKSAIDENAPEILTDVTQVLQVVMNLCTNAAFAMRGRSGVMTIKLESVEAEALPVEASDPPAARYARLTVSDTGCGMSEETRQRIFEPFFTTKGPNEGTGLGLSVVHGIVRDHGGIVTVESELGVGTSFHLYFPEYAVVG